MAKETISSSFIAFYCERGVAKRLPVSAVHLSAQSSANTEREVRTYAEQLLVTPKYLSTVCKEKSGRTAMNWITESTVANIKYYLLQTDLSVKEIAFKLDFPDVSFFCKYVKKHLGQAPIEYRNAQLLSKT